MKQIAILSLLLAFTAGLPLTASAADEHAGHSGHMAHAHSPAEAPLVEGLVKKVDKAAGKLTISHGPLPNGMPAMTMAFKVKNPAWTGQIKEGNKIRFAAESIDGVMTLVRYEAVK